MINPSLLGALLLAAVALAAPPGSAQSAPPSDPADAAAPVPPDVHKASFTGYRRSADPAVTHWPKANATATSVGGWRAYAREAWPPAPADSAACAADGARPQPRNAP